MSKPTTEDCRNFLVKCVEQGLVTDSMSPNHPRWTEGLAAYIRQSMLAAKNWKREYKTRPHDDTFYVCVDGEWVDEPAENFAWVRRFECHDYKGELEGSIAHLVMERLDGTLVLGEDVGD
jgi:hypothetical protein